jgi:hypothetical protein
LLELLLDARPAFEQLEVARAGAWFVALERAFEAALTQHLEPVEHARGATAAQRGAAICAD